MLSFVSSSGPLELVECRAALACMERSGIGSKAVCGEARWEGHWLAALPAKRVTFSKERGMECLLLVL